MKAKCPQCKKEVESKFYEKDNLHVFYCNDCKIGGKADTEEKAKKEFLSQTAKEEQQPYQKPTTPAQPAENKALTIPKKPAELMKWSDDNSEMLIDMSAKFVDRPYLKKMISDNANYISKLDLKGAWETEDGRESVQDALLYSYSLGLNLKNGMGSILPFRGSSCTTVTCVPDRTGVEFALTSGKNPPYKNIKTEIIYANDIYTFRSSPEGEIFFEITNRTLPYGEIVGVVVLGYKIDFGFKVGKIYDIKDIMAKAEKHSSVYQHYLKDMSELRKAQSEGKDYIIKWNKKFYERDISSLYVDADKEKMIAKTAMKSFFADDLKVRDSRAMETERQENEEVQPHDPKVSEVILDHAVSQVKQGAGEIKDAEIVEE